jgi:urea transporter
VQEEIELQIKNTIRRNPLGGLAAVTRQVNLDKTGKRALFITLNSVAQIFFMNKPVLGGAFLLTIAFYSPIQSFTCLLGGTAANLVAVLLKWNQTKILEGLYGYNAALFGLALPVFLEINWSFWLLLLLGSCISALFCEFLSKKGIFPLTIPYVILTWILLFVTGGIHPFTAKHLVNSFWHIPWLGVGQIFFIESALSGFVLFAAIAWFSVREAVWILVGSIIGIIPLFFLRNYDPGFSGLISLNTTLCIIAFIKLKPEVKMAFVLLLTVFTAGLYPIISVVLTSLSLPVLTSPFNVAMSIGLALHSLILRRKICSKGLPLSRKNY